MSTATSLILLALCALCALVSAALAYERTLNVDLTNQYFGVFAKAKNEEHDHVRYRFQFTTLGFPRFRINAFNKTDDEINGFTFRAGFLRVFEYVESQNGTEGYDPSDSIASQYDFFGVLKSFSWSSLRNSHTVENVDGVPVHHLNSTIAFNNGQSSFTFYIHIAEDKVKDSQGRHLSPSAFKFDFKLENYPYTHPQGRIGLLAFVDSAYISFERDADKEEEDTVGINASIQIGNDGYFGWEHSSTVDGQSVAVKSTILFNVNKTIADDDDDNRAGESRDVIEFSWPVTRPRTIYWDPQVGVKDENTSASAGASVVVAVVRTTLMVVAVFAFLALFI
eukprot:GEZU01009440.1.p1 GENE.GEZU01009440.1~~GEZU01009440.1.p1  ORF type:complete len:337 (+),score=94.29 GEZU01009440.1:165-1175(+)